MSSKIVESSGTQEYIETRKKLSKNIGKSGAEICTKTPKSSNNSSKNISKRYEKKFVWTSFSSVSQHHFTTVHRTMSMMLKIYTNL